MTPPPDPEPPPATARAPSPSAGLELLLEIDDDASDADAWSPDVAFLHDWAAHALDADVDGGRAVAGAAILGVTVGAVATDGIGSDPGRPSEARPGRAVRHELSVRLVGAESMRALNREWRGRDAPTNVLSFPAGLPALATPEDDEATALLALGDLAFCPTVIDAEARAQGKARRAHWAHLIVHGVLHLRGLDHEDDDAAVAMEALEIRLLSMRDLPDPYGDRAAAGP